MPAYGRNGRKCKVALRRKIIPLLGSASTISRGWPPGGIGNSPPCPIEGNGLKVIPLSKGETFPPVRSCNKGAFWKYIGS